MSFKELMRCIGCSRAWLDKLVLSGLIKVHKVGTRGDMYLDRKYAGRMIPLLKVRRALQGSLGRRKIQDTCPHCGRGA